MLKTPINVYPSNGQVIYIDQTLSEDPTQHRKYQNAPIFTFTFQGDLLSWAQLEMYNTNTNQLEYSAYCPADGEMYKDIHNNTEMRISAQTLCEYGVNGRNYKYKYRLYQNDPQTGLPLCDMYISRGKVLADTFYNPSEGRYIYQIQSHITNLKDPYYFNYDDNPDSDGRLIGCTYIEIGLERRMILGYNPINGEIAVPSPFSTKIRAGMPYKLFCNYIETGYYDFKARLLPVSQITTKTTDDGLVCNASYLQQNYVGLKSYKFNVYKIGDESNMLKGNLASDYSEYDGKVNKRNIPIGTNITDNLVNKKIVISINDSLKISGVISNYNSTTGIATLKSNLDTMPPPASAYTIELENEALIETMDVDYSYDLTKTFPVNALGSEFRIECEITTQEDCSITNCIYINPEASQDNTGKIEHIRFGATNDDDYSIIDTSEVTLRWNSTKDCYYRIYRQDVDSGKTVFLGKTNRSVSDGYFVKFIDYTIANNHKYKYFIIPCKDGVSFKTYTSKTITVQWDGWYISSIEYDGDKLNRHVYTLGDTWHFVSGINSGDIARNINSALHVGTANYAKTSRDNTKYDSGTFTANLLSISCPNGEIIDDIQRVQKWMQFITDNKTFILKSDKGDAWIINIVNSPSRSYDETVNPILTTISYEWVEVENIESITIKS